MKWAGLLGNRVGALDDSDRDHLANQVIELKRSDLFATAVDHNRLTWLCDESVTKVPPRGPEPFLESFS